MPLKVLKDYLDKELQKENMLITSEYFLSDQKTIGLINQYLIYSNYNEEQRVKDLLITDPDQIKIMDQSLHDLITNLLKIPCQSGKRSIELDKIKSLILDKAYKNIFDNNISAYKSLHNSSVQKAKFHVKLLIEREKIVNRINIVESIVDLFNTKKLLGIINGSTNNNLTQELKDKLVAACKGIGFAKYDVFDKELLLYNNDKIIIHRIDSFEKYIRRLKKISYKNTEETLFFRGHADIKWKLVPSIYREQWIKNEHVLYREIIIRHPSSFREHRSTFEKLTKMQHYYLPTRLLDVTTNPFVALYFACSSNSDSIGEVHLFKVKNEEIKYYDSDTVSVLSNISRTNCDINLNLLPTKTIDKFNDCIEIKKLIHEIRDEKSYFEPKINFKDLGKTLFVKPKLDNERIIRQSGAFILFGINGNKYEPAILKNIYKPQKIHRFIIPNDAKKSIIDDLKIMGIYHSSLFPELEKASIQLKEEYL